MRRSPGFVALFLCAPAALVAAQAVLPQNQLPRVEMNEALRQIVKMVEPVVPSEAAKAGVGGLVVAEAVIRVNGTVESVRVLAGPPPLHQAAIETVKQWTFKPFVRNGKPARVLALIDVKFPDPKGDEERRIQNAYVAARSGCERQLQERSAGAEAACAELTRIAARSHVKNPLARGSAHASYGVALALAGKFQEALTELETALRFRLEEATRDDADVADLLVVTAVVTSRLGDDKKADALYADAERSFEGALKRVPSMAETYHRRLAAALRSHAELKRRLGQPDAASALEARASSLKVEASVNRPSRPVAPVVLRHTGATPCFCPDATQLSDADLAAVAESVPRPARAWLIDGRYAQSSDRASQTFQIFTTAVRETTEYRLGGTGLVSWGSRRPDTTPIKDRWVFEPMATWWLQVAGPGRQLQTPRSRDDANWPIDVNWPRDQGPVTDADVVALVRFVRAEGAKAGPGTSASQIQFWNIDMITHAGSLDFAILLSEPASASNAQQAIVRKTGEKWTVLHVEPRPGWPRR